MYPKPAGTGAGTGQPDATRKPANVYKQFWDVDQSVVNGLKEMVGELPDGDVESEFLISPRNLILTSITTLVRQICNCWIIITRIIMYAPFRALLALRGHL